MTILVYNIVRSPHTFSFSIPDVYLLLSPLSYCSGVKQAAISNNPSCPDVLWKECSVLLNVGEYPYALGEVG